MVLICVSLMVSNVEDLFVCLLVISIPFLKEMSIQFFFPFLNQVIWFFFFNTELYELFMLVINPLLFILLENILSYSVNSHFAYRLLYCAKAFKFN